MRHYQIPEQYRSSLDLKATQRAIKMINDFFEQRLAERLNLLRVSAPLFVKSSTGLNDNLSGIEKPVSFTVTEEPGVRIGAEIVQSLAKWKRNALAQYGFSADTGLYTNMNAIRADEIPDNIHSIYVDQWDWEKIIRPEERTREKLEETVREIFRTFQDVEELLLQELPHYERLLPDQIYFITTEELLHRYPGKTDKEREHLIAKEYKAVFLEQIGLPLSSGSPHDLRSPDYDDWSLNGDILVWSPVLNDALELSSMGIRVDAKVMLRQLALAGATDRLRFPYHKKIVANELPQTIGGGLGQSRISMFFLQKAHIGEVQSSIWPESMLAELHDRGIDLL
ncbi:MAG: aspartate--ammonia ligase [Ndongobacter sp.]|nr:aspartate--ammonia ligase [Ndongobacter sp.]